MLNAIYYVLRRKTDGRIWVPEQVSSKNVPHLYQSRAKAEAKRKSAYPVDAWEVVAVSVNEVKEEQ